MGPGGTSVGRAFSILVVDDDVDARESMVDVLERRGCAVESAGDGAAALARLRAGLRPSVMLIDLFLPRMDGADLLASIRSDPALASVRVIVVTGLASGKVRSLVAADGYLFKPFGADELWREVERVCT